MNLFGFLNDEKQSKTYLTKDSIKTKIFPICAAYGVERCFLFGSYARGEATEVSDVDLRIVPGRIRSLFTYGAFYNDVKEVLGKEIDIISTLPDSLEFQENLKREEILIYGN